MYLQDASMPQETFKTSSTTYRDERTSNDHGSTTESLMTSQVGY